MKIGVAGRAGQGFSWWVTLLDCTIYEFGDNAPLQSIRDRYGNAIKLIRESGQHGKITKLISPHNRWIAFTYDGSNRITQAKDNLGRTVGYQYDGSGRLWKVTDAAGGVTEYTYDTSHRMLTVSAGGRGERATRVEPQRVGVGPREREARIRAASPT